MRRREGLEGQTEKERDIDSKPEKKNRDMDSKPEKSEGRRETKSVCDREVLDGSS